MFVLDGVRGEGARLVAGGDCAWLTGISTAVMLLRVGWLGLVAFGVGAPKISWMDTSLLGNSMMRLQHS